MKIINSLKVALTITSFLLLSSCISDDNSGGGEQVRELNVLFTSNVQNGNIVYYDLTNRKNITITSLSTPSSAADGIYYDSSSDVAVQASRSANALEGYINISLQSNNTQVAPALFGTADMESPRKMVVKDDLYVVADNANDNGRFFIYNRIGNNFKLRNVVTVGFKVWGISFNDDALYAVVDGTNEMAVFNDFLDTKNTVTLDPQKRIKVEGIVRTHGIFYDDVSDTLLLTDIGDASNAENDGAFHLISNFSTKMNGLANGGALAISEQIRVSGSKTFLGNPVDVTYDDATGTVYVAEAGNAGGRLLAFENFGNGGDIPPFISNSLTGASSVYLYKERVK